MAYDLLDATPAQYIDLTVLEDAPDSTEPLVLGPSASGRAMKRTLDIALAGIALVVVAPLMVVLTVAVWLASPGRPMFGQERLGRDGRVFRCWKFRSMHRDAEEILVSDPELYAAYVANDFKLSCANDPRITTIGRFLRASSLDELPQLFNVLIGDMSLVGPRPVVPAELDRCYGPWTGAYLAVRPGVTGPWQVGGRNDIRYPERAALDADYVNTWRFRHDLMILARTPAALLRGPGPTT
jgi:exopolysaccharide production protein ExoY